MKTNRLPKRIANSIAKIKARQVLLYAAIALLISQSALAQQNGAINKASKDKVAKIEEVLTLAHKYRQFNGTALVAENGRVIYKGGFGMANMEWAIPNTPDTRFRLGSITKQFTSMLTLQLSSKTRSSSTERSPITCQITGKISGRK